MGKFGEYPQIYAINIRRYVLRVGIEFLFCTLTMFACYRMECGDTHERRLHESLEIHPCSNAAL